MHQLFHPVLCIVLYGGMEGKGVAMWGACTEALFTLSFCLLEFNKTPSARSVMSPAHAAAWYGSSDGSKQAVVKAVLAVASLVSALLAKGRNPLMGIISFAQSYLLLPSAVTCLGSCVLIKHSKSKERPLCSLRFALEKQTSKIQTATNSLNTKCSGGRVLKVG